MNLCDHGFQHVPAALSVEFCARLREKCEALAEGQMDKSMAATLVFPATDPDYIQLVRVGAELLQLPDVRYIAGAVIPKYPGEGRRRWHTDWWDWDAPESRWYIPTQAGVIFYIDRAVESGCLAAVPGSNRSELPKHLKRSYETFEQLADEVRVPCERGDAVIIDSRLLHAVTENTTDRTRFAITVWYMIDWANLSEQIRSSAMLCYDASLTPLLGTLYMEYSGTVQPKPHNTTPKFKDE